MTAFWWRDKEGDYASRSMPQAPSPVYLVAAAAVARLDAGGVLELPAGWARTSLEAVSWQMGAYGPVHPVTVRQAHDLAELARALLAAHEREAFLPQRELDGARELIKTVAGAERWSDYPGGPTPARTVDGLVAQLGAELGESLTVTRHGYDLENSRGSQFYDRNPDGTSTAACLCGQKWRSPRWVTAWGSLTAHMEELRDEDEPDVPLAGPAEVAEAGR